MGRQWFLGAALILAACNTTPQMNIPRPATDGEDTAVQTAGTPALFDHDAPTEPIAFLKVVSGIRFGTTILHYPAGGPKGASDPYCNYNMGSDATVSWEAGNTVLAGWKDDAGIVFYDVMSNVGYDIAGDPDQLFGEDEDRDRARFLIAARLEEIRGNICHLHSWWDGRPLNRFSGEMYVKLTWGIQDRLTGDVVASLETEGFHLESHPTQIGVTEIFLKALGSATAKLAFDPEFNAAISKPDPEAVAAAAAPLNDETILLNTLPVSGTPFVDQADQIVQSVVQLSYGGGHGSGFILSDSGYVLTNQHVVGSAEILNVTFANGMTVQGKVLRTHEQRDVALVQVPLQGLTPLTLNTNPPRLTEDLYAIGSPLDPGLQSTITKGTVSSFRTESYTGVSLPYIQSDTPVHPGNSGGPVLDKYGNVVAIVVSGIGETESLNFFIPIESALEYLNIELGTSGS